MTWRQIFKARYQSKVNWKAICGAGTQLLLISKLWPMVNGITCTLVILIIQMQARSLAPAPVWLRPDVFHSSIQITLWISVRVEEQTLSELFLALVLVPINVESCTGYKFILCQRIRIRDFMSICTRHTSSAVSWHKYRAELAWISLFKSRRLNEGIWPHKQSLTLWRLVTRRLI